MRILAVTVVYQADPELLLRSIASYAEHVEKVLVWQNSPLPDRLTSDLKAFGNVSFRGDGSNAGISKALNAAWREAVAEGYDALLTMDQDSVWHHCGDFLSVLSGPEAPEGFYVPRIHDGPEEGAVERRTGTGLAFTPVDTAFTSGMFLPLGVLEKVGDWDEDFTVDGVDNEFCLHALSLGIPCWQVNTGWLEHSLGKVEFRRLLGLRFRVYNYPPERLYGIYRNNLIAIRKYPLVSKKYRRHFWKTWGWKRPVRMLLGERDLRAKFHAIRRGISDARKARCE